MAETTKTRADLLDPIFRDNIAGEISPEDVRCLVLSALGDFGGWARSGGVTPQSLSVPNGTTYVTCPAVGLTLTTLTNDGAISGDTANRRIAISAATPGPTVCLVAAVLSIGTNAATDSIRFTVGIFKNSDTSPVVGSVVEFADTLHGSGASMTPIVVAGIVPVTAGDYLYVKIRHNGGSTQEVYFYGMTFMATRIQ